MKIVIMGSASAAAGKDRDNTYLLLNDGEFCTMIDVGGNPLGKLKKLGIPLSHVRNVVFTHFHIDHIYGFPSLLWGMWIDGRTEPLDVYCASAYRKQLEDWLQVLRPDQWPVRFEIRIHDFDWTKPSELFRRERMTVSVFPAIHEVPTVGLKVEVGERVVVYSADSRLNPVIGQMSKIDLLIHEAAHAERESPVHSTLTGIISYYLMAAIEKIVIVHWTDDEPYERILNSVDPALRGKISMGQDMMVIHLADSQTDSSCS